MLTVRGRGPKMANVYYVICERFQFRQLFFYWPTVNIQLKTRYLAQLLPFHKNTNINHRTPHHKNPTPGAPGAPTIRAAPLHPPQGPLRRRCGPPLPPRGLHLALGGVHPPWHGGTPGGARGVRGGPEPHCCHMRPPPNRATRTHAHTHTRAHLRWG